MTGTTVNFPFRSAAQQQARPIAPASFGSLDVREKRGFPSWRRSGQNVLPRTLPGTSSCKSRD
jgi:hypothetical protein